MSASEPHHEGNEMDRFDREGLRRWRARDAVSAVLLGAVILALAAGSSIKRQGETMKNQLGRDAVLAIGDPAASAASALPVQTLAHRITGWIHPNPQITGPGGFTAAGATLGPGGVPPATPDAFDPATIGARAPARRPLHTVLVTGDSMSQPLDQDVAQLLAPRGVNVIQDPHLGTAISSTILVNWGQLAAYQVRHDHPQAVVMFIGANEGFAMPGPHHSQTVCCGVAWATEFAQRVREMMNTYRQDGAAHVYWLTLPTPRDATRAMIARVVNAAVRVAAQPWADQISIVDTVPVFTPHGYRDSMLAGGQPTIVRESDGVHLNQAGSVIAAHLVVGNLGQNFTLSGGG